VKLPPALTIVAIVACVVSVGMALAVLAPAADPRLAEIENDPEARRLLDEVVGTYQHLDAYADQGEFVLAATTNGKSERERSPLKLSFMRPNKMRLDTGEVLLVSDGTTLTTVVVPLKKYTTAAAPKTLTFDMLQMGPLGSILFGGPSARPMFVVLNLLVGSDPVKALGELGGTLAVDNGREVGGVACKALRLDGKDGPGLRLLVDPESKLLRAIDLVFDPQALFEKGGQDNVTIDSLGWVAGPITTKDLPADAFAFVPPQGFSKVESIAQAAGVIDKSPVEELVGKPAPDFTLTVLDGAGKTRTLSRNDLAGKVVLIDFWATWCQPCLIELPEIQKLIETYSKDKKDVLIVALSQDDEPSGLAELRKLVEKTLAEKEIKLTGTPVGLVGLDPSHSVQDAFKVEALPTVVLLDGKGVVQAAHVGVPKGDVSEVRRSLGEAIDTLLAGKSLAPEAEEAAPVGPGKPKE